MEDENGLELSLGLSCGGSSGKSKGRDAPSDASLDEGSSSKLLGGNITTSDISFKNFLQTSAENQVHSGKQKGDPVSPSHENFWTDLGKHAATVANVSKDVQSSQSQFTRYQQPWIPNNKTTDSEEQKSGINKRKFSFEEINIQKKHEKVVDHGDAQVKGLAGVNLLKRSPISVTAEDASSGENEDVAESEAEGSNSWLVSQREDNSKRSEVPKVADKHVLNDHSGISFQGQKQLSFSGNDSNPEIGKVAYGIPLPLQPLTVMSVPYSVPVKVSTTSGAPNATGVPSPCVVQLMPLANNERPVVQTMNTSNLQLAFGYSPVQLPTLERSSSWALGSQPQHVSSFAIKDNADGASQHSEDEMKRSHAFTYEGKSSELAKGSGKHIGEAGASSSSQVEEEGRGSNTIFINTTTAPLLLLLSLSQKRIFLVGDSWMGYMPSLRSKAVHLVSDLTTVILNPISDKPSKPPVDGPGVKTTEKEVSEEDSGDPDGPDTSSFTAFLISLLSPSDSGSHPVEDLNEHHAEMVDTALASEIMENSGKKSLLSRGKQSLGRAIHKAARLSGLRQSSEPKTKVVNESKLVEHEMKPVKVPQEVASQFSLPDMSEPSLLLSEDLRNALYAALPALVQGRNWLLLYSTWRHGISLSTLYRRSMLCPGYSLLIVGDQKGAVFGGLVEAPLCPTNRKKYQGTNRSFVFTNLSSHAVIYRPTGANHYFTLCSTDSLALGGGGHFALYLDGDLLNGSSSTSETFGNSCLAHSEDFEVKEVELWGFVYASKYDEMVTLCRTEKPGVCRW